MIETTLETNATPTTKSPGTMSPRSHLLGEPMGDLVFKIRGGEHHGRVVRLRSLKCTIGSSADCTLRLCAEGVRAMHCLVMRGEAGAVVRRWSPDTQLNGHTFDDALLKPGDRLRVGPVELELLEADPTELTSPARNFPALKLPSNIPSTASIPPVPTAALVEEITAKVKSKIERNKFRRLRLRTRKKLAAAKARIVRLKKQIRRVEKTLQENLAERAQFQATLAKMQSLQSDAEHQFHSSLAQMQNSQLDAEKQFQATIAQLQNSQNKAEQQLQATQYQLQCSQRDAETQIQASRAELQTRHAQWEQTQRDLQSTQQLLQERSETWSLEKSELERTLALNQATLAQLEGEAVKKSKTLEQLQIELRIARQVTDQSELQTLQDSLTESLCEQEHLREALKEAIQLHHQNVCSLNELQQRHRDANESLELLVSEEETARRTIASLNKKIEELEFALLTEAAEHETGTNGLRKELSAAQENCQNWQLRVEELLQAASATEENTISRLNRELYAAQQQVQEAQAAGDQHRQAADALRSQLEQQTAQLIQSQADEQSAQRACAELSAQLATLQAQIERDCSTLAQQEVRIAELEQLGEQWQQKFQALQLEESSHQADASLENAQLREALGQAKSQLEDATQQRLTELAQASADHARICEEIANVTAETNQLREQIATREKDFNAQISVATDKIQSLEAQIEQLKQITNIAQEALTSRELDFTAQASEATNKIQWLEAQIEQLKRETSVAQEAVASSELKLATQSSEATQKINTLETRIEELSQASLLSLDSMEKNQQADLQELQNKLHAAWQERDALQATIAELSGQLREQRDIGTSQVEERDCMLAQIRNEVREQMRAWENEKAELLSKLQAAANTPSLIPTTNEQTKEVQETPIIENKIIRDADEKSFASQDQCNPELTDWQQDWKSRMTSLPETDTFSSESVANEFDSAGNQPQNHYFAPPPLAFDDRRDEAMEADQHADLPSPVTQEDNALNAVLARLGAAGILKNDAANIVEDKAPASYAYAESARTEVEEVRDIAAVTTLPSETTQEKSFEADETETESAQTPTVSHASASMPTEVIGTTESQSDDDSIEDYMNKLLRRVRGDSVANAFTTQHKPVVAPVEVESNSPPAESEATHEPLPELEYVPRAQPPEMNINLSALRELAVNSAHQAIDLSRIRGQKQQAIGTSFAAICAFACGNVLLYYGQQYGMRWAAFAAIVSFGLGTHWVIQRLKMLRPTKNRLTKSSGPQLPPREKKSHARTTIVEPDADSNAAE